MSNTTIIKAYNKFINLQIEPFLNNFQDKKIQLHVLRTLSSLSFMEEDDDRLDYDQELKQLFIHDSNHFSSANDNDYITHVKVEESNAELFEFIKKCVKKDIKNGEIDMEVGKKAEEWIEYLKQLIHNAECKDEYYQAFQEWPAYPSNLNYTEISSLPDSNYSGNGLLDFNKTGNSLSNLPDGGTLKPDYSLLLVFPCVILLLFLVCFINCYLEKLRARAANTSNSSCLAIIDYEHGEFCDIELRQQGPTRTNIG